MEGFGIEGLAVEDNSVGGYIRVKVYLLAYLYPLLHSWETHN
jgi:hypothetical protein